ncbi:hypothetical protein N7528_004044 [Penicillium herquei]|nr:hypothetical protein N7528_004044 [Penicillium herquei]
MAATVDRPERAMSQYAHRTGQDAWIFWEAKGQATMNSKQDVPLLAWDRTIDVSKMKWTKWQEEGRYGVNVA